MESTSSAPPYEPDHAAPRVYPTILVSLGELGASAAEDAVHLVAARLPGAAALWRSVAGSVDTQAFVAELQAALDAVTGPDALHQARAAGLQVATQPFLTVHLLLVGSLGEEAVRASLEPVQQALAQVLAARQVAVAALLDLGGADDQQEPVGTALAALAARLADASPPFGVVFLREAFTHTGLTLPPEHVPALLAEFAAFWGLQAGPLRQADPERTAALLYGGYGGYQELDQGTGASRRFASFGVTSLAFPTQALQRYGCLRWAVLSLWTAFLQPAGDEARDQAEREMVSLLLKTGLPAPEGPLAWADSLVRYLLDPPGEQEPLLPIPDVRFSEEGVPPAEWPARLRVYDRLLGERPWRRAVRGLQEREEQWAGELDRHVREWLEGTVIHQPEGLERARAGLRCLRGLAEEAQREELPSPAEPDVPLAISRLEEAVQAIPPPGGLFARLAAVALPVALLVGEAVGRLTESPALPIARVGLSLAALAGAWALGGWVQRARERHASALLRESVAALRRKHQARLRREAQQAARRVWAKAVVLVSAWIARADALREMLADLAWSWMEEAEQLVGSTASQPFRQDVAARVGPADPLAQRLRQRARELETGARSEQLPHLQDDVVRQVILPPDRFEAVVRECPADLQALAPRLRQEAILADWTEATRAERVAAVEGEVWRGEVTDVFQERVGRRALEVVSPAVAWLAGLGVADGWDRLSEDERRDVWQRLDEWAQPFRAAAPPSRSELALWSADAEMRERLTRFLPPATLWVPQAQRGAATLVRVWCLLPFPVPKGGRSATP